MVSLLAGLQGIPKELYEAADIDGANELQKFWYITIPQLMPIIISIALLDFIWTMQVFPLVWMTTGGGPIHATEMLSTYTYKLAFSRVRVLARLGERRRHPAHLDEHDLLLHQASEGAGRPAMAQALVQQDPSLPTVLVYLGLAVGLVFAGFPILWMFFSSLKSNTEIFALPPRLLPDDLHARRLSIDLQRPGQGPLLPQQLPRRRRGHPADGRWSRSWRPTRFSRYKFRLKNTLNVFIISTQTVPPITLLIPYFGMVVAFGIFNTYFALILTYMVFTLPYAILLMTGYLNTLPKELDEAVLVDGGSSWTALWRVIVPISVPGIVATAVYTFLLAWNEFLFALTLTKSMDMRTVPIGISC